ncbi:glycerophosphodiester phosphodiesterase [Candidatus Parvarchaeota archaeon]|jgi:glycerophosphoryl diester phosphodiesterase|nr:glycerophosphodiester phosphodiesterase [Candidatus Parvarchaeota archaeon]
MRMPLVYGHRGAAIEAPENTLPSFKLAKKLGVYGVEMDLHTSKDGELIVMHDETLDRTTNGSGLIHLHTIEEIKRLDAGFKFGKRWKGTRVSTLREVFEGLGRINYYLEIKQSSKIYPGIEEKMLNLISEFNLKNNVQIISFDFDSLEIVRELDKTIITGLLYTGKSSWFIDIAKTLKINFLQPSFNLIYQEDIEIARKNGFKVAAWTVDTVEEIKRAIDLKVDSITSNNPRLVLRMLKRYAKL